MIQAVARATLLACLLTLSISAKFLLNDYIISPKAVVVLEKMSSELTKKTGINAYVIATNEKLKVGTNLYDYSDRFKSSTSEPYVIYIFAPNALITKDASQTGRMGIIPSSKELKGYYDSNRIKRYAIDILKSEDSNSLQSKYDLAVIQAYSELADEIAEHKGVTLDSTLKEKYNWIINIFTWVVRIGAILIFWIYLGRPLYNRIVNGKK